MIKKITIFIFALFLATSCKTMDPKIQLEKQGDLDRYNSVYLDRAKNLYSCGSFFRIVGKKRTKIDEVQRYEKVSIEAKQLADILVAKADGNPQIKDIELSKKYYKYGAEQSIEMVKEIGKDRTGKKFKEITVSCYQSVEKEKLVSDIKILNNRLNKSNK